MSRFKVLGVNDEAEDCECCGKTGLKRVVWIEDTETLKIQHFGTTCAESPAKAFGLKKEIKKAVRACVAAEQAKARAERNVKVTAASKEASATFTGKMITVTVAEGPMKGHTFNRPEDQKAFDQHKAETIARLVPRF